MRPLIKDAESDTGTYTLRQLFQLATDILSNRTADDFILRHVNPFHPIVFFCIPPKNIIKPDAF